MSYDKNDEGNMEWYINDSWTINISDGNAIKQSYKAEKEDYEKNYKHVAGVKAKRDDIIMLEMRGNTISLWINNQEIAHNFFED